jgi:predicted small secreted protein
MSRKISMHAMVIAVAMTLAACGGGNDANNGGSAPVATQGSGDTSSNDSGSSVRDGYVEVDGTVFEFSFDPPGRCGIDAGDGTVVAQGFMVDDPSRQVAFTYALAENSSDGEDWLQIVLYDASGNQLWYSAVGFTSDPVGSVTSLEENGDTVTASGELLSQLDGTLAEFTAEATCTG